MEARVPARLSRAEGRKFGLTVGVAFLVLAGLLHFWRHREAAATIMGAIGGLMSTAAVAMPTRLGLVQRVWMGLAHAISKVTTPVFMGVVFFVVITPIGLLMRVFGRHPLVHRLHAGGFWIAPPSGGRSNLDRQF